jgi:hypothetical protein
MGLFAACLDESDSFVFALLGQTAGYLFIVPI